ncbi:hypothetical protein [Vogesella indigofera]|uniref:hypothetical protein n=1 Tax=Vogesella indigofera TaxID=45465 RepID=UPI00234ED713|nr:hypothetical protein [Vogesella indigofera]MDC7709307.1 hypothetical protein [Vogesella indigofera]
MLPLRPALRLSLLATALIAANLVHAEVPASAPFTAEQQHVIQQLSASEVRAAAPKIASEAASSVAKTIEGEQQAIEVAKDALEVGRKSVDFWLGFLGVLTGAIALFGFITPWLVVKNYKEKVEKSAKDLADLQSQAKAHAELLIDRFELIKLRVDELDKFEIKLKEMKDLLDLKAQKIETLSLLVEERVGLVQVISSKTVEQLEEVRSLVDNIAKKS